MSKIEIKSLTKAVQEGFEEPFVYQRVWINDGKAEHTKCITTLINDDWHIIHNHKAPHEINI